MKNGLHIDQFGAKFYYLNDKFHREENLPAIEWENGDKWYFVNGKCHRENGPAKIGQSKDGTQLQDLYYINDVRFSEEDYWKEIKKRKSLDYILFNYVIRTYPLPKIITKRIGLNEK